MPGVLLDHVAHDPAQAGGPAVGPGAPGQLLQAAVGQRLGDQGAGAGHGVLPERMELLRTGLGGAGERLPYAPRFNIRQLTDVLHCKLQQHFRCNEH